jgi:hypothetical protein
MTTSITIENTSVESGYGAHDVVIRRHGEVVQTLKPGQKTTALYVWHNTTLVIEEKPIE